MKVNKSESSLKRDTVSGVTWNFLSQGIGLLNQLTIGVILARLLPPEDFGLIGIALIVIGFGNLFVDLGLGPALIQRTVINKNHVRICFTISGFAGLLLAILVFFTSTFIADVFRDQRVTEIVKALAIVFVFAGFQIPSQAILKRHLAFKSLFKINLVNTIIYGLITITLALFGFGVWSLVIGIIIQRFANLFQNYLYVRHNLIPLIKKKEFYDLANFGGGMSLISIFNYAANRGDYFLVGRLLGSTSLGLYTRAYNLMQMPTDKFASVISNVLFPAVSKIQDETIKFQRAFLNTLSIVSFIVLPLIGLLIVIAPELIINIYGEKWKGAIKPFQILALFGLFRALYNSAGAFIKAKGKVYQLLVCQIIYCLLIIFGVWFAAPRWGLEGTAWAVGLAITFQYLALMYLGSIISGVTFKDIILTLKPSILISTPSILIIYVLNSILIKIDISGFLSLFIEIVISMIVFLGFIYFLPQKSLQYMPYRIIMIIERYLPSNKNYYAKIINHFSPQK